MYTLETTDLGNITISKEAVETLAGLATVDCYGLAGMVSRKVSDDLTSILGLDSIRKGVEVQETPDGLNVEVFIVVTYGTKISVVASNVMQKIRYTMEKVAGIHVNRVNVFVKGVKVLND
ncbi:MAG: Asp23/Gls24 family envelope stress response protein [Solirubrobacterales bacterium]